MGNQEAIVCFSLLLVVLTSATTVEKDLTVVHTQKHSVLHRHVRTVNHLAIKTIEHNKLKARQHAILAKDSAFGINVRSPDLPIKLVMYEHRVTLGWYTLEQLLASADLIEGDDAPTSFGRPNVATEDNGIYDHVLNVEIPSKFALDAARIKAKWLVGVAEFFLARYKSDFIRNYQLGRVRHAMCQVFASDPWNIVNYFIHPDVDPTGDSMGVPVMRALLKINRKREGYTSIEYFDKTSACLDAILAGILDPLATLGADTTLPLEELPYARPAAQTGYFFGCMSAAYYLNLKNQQAILESEKQLLSGLVETALSNIPLPFGPALSAVAKFAAKKIVSNVIKESFDDAKREAYKEAMGKSKSLQSTIRNMVSADTDRGLIITRWILVEYLNVKDASHEHQD